MIAEREERNHQLRVEAIRAASPIIAEAVRALGNVATSTAQAAATSPMAAGASAVFLGSIMNIWDRKGGTLLQAAGVTYTGAKLAGDLTEVVAGGVADIIGAVTGAPEKSEAQAINISFDVPDVPGQAQLGAGPNQLLIEALDARKRNPPNGK